MVVLIKNVILHESRLIFTFLFNILYINNQEKPGQHAFVPVTYSTLKLYFLRLFFLICLGCDFDFFSTWF